MCITILELLEVFKIEPNKAEHYIIWILDREVLQFLFTYIRSYKNHCVLCY